jgi:hypothetical protein
MLIEEIDNDSHGIENVELDGRRVVDISWFFDNMRLLANHNPMMCTFNDIHLVSENRRGLHSSFKWKCTMCKRLLTVRSENPNSNKEKMSLNMCIVSGALSIGCGFSQLQESTAVIGIPFMADSTYQIIHDKVYDAQLKTALTEMQEAAEEEKELAILANDFDVDGIPQITVAVDGAWAKRTYRTNYNSLSGVAAIVGHRTRKVLFIGVRNKYCTVCQRSISRQKEPVKHSCSKNYFGSSSGMEADIIAEGFSRSIEMYGLKYSRFIGDGDSSVYRKLDELMPYAPRPQLTR